MTGKPLFTVPTIQARTWHVWQQVSKAEGWPSFRDAEVISGNVRVCELGEVISADGTFLGFNEPDREGNFYNMWSGG